MRFLQATDRFFEFSVDLVLLYIDPTNGSGWKVFHLAFSERLKAAEQMVDFTAPGKVPAVHSEAESFIRHEKNSIDDMRRTLLPNAKTPSKAVHPDRWTRAIFLGTSKLRMLAYRAPIKASLGNVFRRVLPHGIPRMNWRSHLTMAAVTNPDRICCSTAAVLRTRSGSGLRFLRFSKPRRVHPDYSNPGIAKIASSLTPTSIL